METETRDGLKPIRCGCGGEAKVKKYTFHHALPLYRVRCETCGMQSGVRDTEAEAIQVWNRAMGAGKDEIAITKGYWMATYDGLYCSVCNYKCETTALPEVCPHCGTSLTRW